VIDLHTHSTASDGRCTPAELVLRASAAGVTVLAVTDHDTVGGCDAVRAACASAGIGFVPGIEITAVLDGRDIHVLGYFLDAASPVLARFLAEQRQQRLDRVRRIVERLAQFGLHLDADAIVAPAVENPSRSAGRPWVARALVAAGYVASTDEAFSRWLERGKPAFIAREGPAPAEVCAEIHRAGGLASLAHPGLVRRDESIGELAASGLDALEAYHSEHDAAATARYLALASRLSLAVTGGSDFHGDAAHGALEPGSVSLPPEAFEALERRFHH
jgi:predicted metal-dependent phosphoesterase TrpH